MVWANLGTTGSSRPVNYNYQDRFCIYGSNPLIVRCSKLDALTSTLVSIGDDEIALNAVSSLLTTLSGSTILHWNLIAN
jgi:hypothetical protein